jgi:hypothetical protein
MSIKRVRAALLVLAALLGTHAASAAPFSADTHDVHPGDFPGDGKSDLLVIAKDPATCTMFPGSQCGRHCSAATAAKRFG